MCWHGALSVHCISRPREPVVAARISGTTRSRPRARPPNDVRTLEGPKRMTPPPAGDGSAFAIFLSLSFLCRDVASRLRSREARCPLRSLPSVCQPSKPPLTLSLPLPLPSPILQRLRRSSSRSRLRWWLRRWRPSRRRRRLRRRSVWRRLRRRRPSRRRRRLRRRSVWRRLRRRRWRRQLRRRRRWRQLRRRRWRRWSPCRR